MSTRARTKAPRPSVAKGYTKISTAPHASKALHKGFYQVDVNISSYNRTDPFTALNTLLKLFSSLPARLGGCQYKFTPEEHKLSMHLLKIVEPFVGVAQSRRTLTRQPTELLDAIVFHIDSKRDLLSLALACKRLHSIVFPRHYDYRIIKAKVSSLRLWNHLIVNRSLSRNIRVLEILDERTSEPELMPTDILGTDTDLESTDDELGLHVKQERFLSSALARMTTLGSFTWSCNHSPISIDHVWPSLLKCQTLDQIEINDNLLFKSKEQSETDITNKAKSRQNVLPDLRTVSLSSTKHAYGSTKNPSLEKVSTLLNNCPNLENLAISYAQRRGGDYLNPAADDLLLCGRWPQLRSLSLANLYCSPHTGLDVATAFLNAHSDLQVLHIDLSTATAAAAAHLALPPDTLPRLRELRSSREFASALLRCPCSAPDGRPLETIKGVRLGGGGSDEAFLCSLKAFGGQTVRRLDLLAWNEMEDVKRLVECVPRLTWLDLGKRCGTSSAAVCGDAASSSRTLSIAHANAVEWATLLSPLSELATFHGVKFFYEVTAADPNGPGVTTSERSRLKKNEEVASVLAWKCPRLRRVDHWEDGTGKVIVLVRDGEKVRHEVRRVKA